MSDFSAQTRIILDPDLAKALQPSLSTTYATAKVFDQLMPALYGYSDKKQQPLQKVDYYMLEETEELITRLSRFCAQLNINPSCEFKVARRGNHLQVIGNFEGRDALTQMVNDDLWFVDSFIWLQPNYSSLAHSFEVLDYSEHYQQSPQAAAKKYAHFVREDKGLAFALRYANGAANAQVESPLNLYRVEG